LFSEGLNETFLVLAQIIETVYQYSAKWDQPKKKKPTIFFWWIMALWPYVEGLKEHKKLQYGILAKQRWGMTPMTKISTRGLRLEVACTP